MDATDKVPSSTASLCRTGFCTGLFPTEHQCAIDGGVLDADARERLESLQRMKEDWLTQSVEPALRLRREVITGNAAMADVVALEREARGKKVMDAMRGILSEVEALEEPRADC